MNKTVIKLITLIMMAALVLSGCNLIRTDPEYIKQQEAERLAAEQAAYEADMAAVVANFEGGTVTNADVLGEFLAQYNNAYYMKYMLYSMGMMATPQVTQDEFKELQTASIENVAQQKILYMKAEQMGVSTEFEGEELAAIEAEADTTYANALSYYAMNMGYDASMVESIGFSRERCLEQAKLAAIESKLSAIVNKDTAVTDAEVKASYDELLSAQQTACETNPSALEENVLNGDIALYYPEGYRYVKHILLMPADSALTANVRTLSNEISALDAEIAALDTQIAELESATVSEPSTSGEAIVTAESLEAQKAQKLSDRQAKQAAHEDAISAVWNDLQPKLDEVNARIEAGEDFDALIDEYTQDPGSRNEPIKTNGYLIYDKSTKWDPAFLEAALGIQSPGECAQPVLGASGIHIIKYESATSVGALAFEDVKDKVTEITLKDKQDTLYDDARRLWYEEANLAIDLGGWKL